MVILGLSNARWSQSLCVYRVTRMSCACAVHAACTSQSSRICKCTICPHCEYARVRSPLLRCPRADARKSYINAANEIKRVCAFVRDEYVFAQMVKVFGRDYSNEMTNVQCICV